MWTVVTSHLQSCTPPNHAAQARGFSKGVTVKNKYTVTVTVTVVTVLGIITLFMTSARGV